MTYSHEEVTSRALEYAASRGLALVEQLGFGVHGIVWSSNQRSAIKCHAPHSRYYERERNIYLRLRDEGVTEVSGFHVPELVDFNDHLWAIEIAIVQPPFVLDFAGAYLDERPDFSDETWSEWRAEKQEQFGKNWSKARAVIAALEQYGVYMSDVSPNNIRFVE